MKPTRNSSRSPTCGVQRRGDEMYWCTICINDAKLDALISRGYLAASEREDAPAVQEALQAFLADRLSAAHLH